MRKLLVSLVALNLLVLGLAGCSGTNAPKVVPKRADTYIIGETESGDWGYPSPYGYYPRGPGQEKMALVFDTLVWRDDTGLVPALASKWTYNAADDSYLLQLRPNVKWHDGQPFTSSDVTFTFAYAKKYHFPSDSNFKFIDHVETLGPYTVKIYLKNPYANFVQGVLCAYPMLPSHIWATVANPTSFQEPQAVVGTGPYKLVDYNAQQQSYLFEANSDYFLGKPKVKYIRFMNINPNIAPAALKVGQIDAFEMTYSQADEIKAAGFKELAGNYDWVVQLMFNQNKAPFSSMEFRQALAYAIDRKQIVQIANAGQALPGSIGMIPVDSPWYDAKAGHQYEYNPDKAKALLASLGYRQTGAYLAKNGHVLQVSLLTKAGKGSFDNTKEAQIVKQNLEAIGIKVDLQGLDPTTIDGMINQWNFDLAIEGHGGMEGDPDLLRRFVKNLSFNSARFTSDSALLSCLDAQSQAMDPKQRKALVFQAQELLAQDVPMIPLTFVKTFWAADDRIPLFFNKPGYVGNTRPTNKEAFFRR